MKKGISARVLADSISPFGHRLVTLEVTHHRFILPEFNTHRLLSRGSASSRAIPVWKRCAEVIDNLAWPHSWGRNKSGMQAADTLSGPRLWACEAIWKGLSLTSAAGAWTLSQLGLHKQLANRPLEPYLWHTAIVSSTSWRNLFHQRDHWAAQPEFQDLAYKMRQAIGQSRPKQLELGQWHMPLIIAFEKDLDCFRTELIRESLLTKVIGLDPLSHLELLKKVSVARCARVSYLNHEGSYSLRSDLSLYDKLAKTFQLGDPPHAGPFEHVATPGRGSGNFKGWNQFRHMEFPDKPHTYEAESIDGKPIIVED